MGFLMGFWSGKLPSEWLLNPLSFARNFRGGVVEAINFTDMTRTTRPGACNFCSKGPPFSTPSTKESNSAKRMGPLCTWRKVKQQRLYQRLSTWHLQLLLLKINAWKMKFPFGCFAHVFLAQTVFVSENLRHPGIVNLETSSHESINSDLG